MRRRPSAKTGIDVPTEPPIRYSNTKIIAAGEEAE